jgi:hypothetical protein
MASQEVAECSAPHKYQKIYKIKPKENQPKILRSQYLLSDSDPRLNIVPIEWVGNWVNGWADII